MADSRERPISLPQPREKKSHIARIEAEHRIRHMLPSLILSPQPQVLDPVDDFSLARPVDTSHMHAVAIPVASDRRAGVSEQTRCLHKFLAILRVGCIEIRSGRVTQIPLRNEICQNNQPVARPTSTFNWRECTNSSDMVVRTKLVERAPALHGEKRVLGRSRNRSP